MRRSSPGLKAVLTGLLVALLLIPLARVSAQAPVQRLTVLMGEGEVISDVFGQEQTIGEFHRWEPPVLVVFRGTRVVLEVKNPRKHYHSFVIPDLGVQTGLLEPRTGSKSVEFVADKAGVFEFRCGLEYDAAKGYCELDHKRQVGYLIVLDR